MFLRKKLYSGSSQHGDYTIVETMYEGRKARVLYGKNHTPQSGAALDGSPELLFNYNQRFLEMIESRQVKRVLVIGGGVMMLPIAVHERFVDVVIDVVEIDPLLIDLAFEHFDAPRSERLSIHINDGLKFLQPTHQMYDAIILDAFSGFDIPVHLLDRAAVVIYKQHLQRDGFVAVNLLSKIISQRDRLAAEVVMTFEEEFRATAVYQADSEYPLKEEQNIVVVASDGSIDFDYLQSEDVRDRL